MKFRAGDIIKYSGSAWCRHGIARVGDDGIAWDSYWGASNHPGYDCLTSQQIESAELIGNIGDFSHPPYPFQFFDYCDADTLFIPMGSTSEVKLVRVGSVPSREQVEHRLRREIDSAKWKIERAEKDWIEVRQKLDELEQTAAKDGE